jgi:hypothetical protein
MNFFLTAILLTALMACGKAKDLPKFEDQNLQTASWPADGSNIRGSYEADFITLNTNINGFITTKADIVKVNDHFQVAVKLLRGPPKVWHKQDIRIGVRCPTEKDDTNKDGFIDIVEGDRVWGKVVLPLDDDLEGQDAGEGSYPISDDEGSYEYKRFAGFDLLFNDLKGTSDPSAPIMKLTENMGLGIEGNVIVILGTDPSIPLPASVATLADLDRPKSFPLVCGLIRKVSDQGGEVDLEVRGNLATADGPDANSPAPGPAPLPPQGPTPDPVPENETTTDSSPSDYGNDHNDSWDEDLRRWWRRTWGRIIIRS